MALGLPRRFEDERGEQQPAAADMPDRLEERLPALLVGGKQDVVQDERERQRERHEAGERVPGAANGDDGRQHRRSRQEQAGRPQLRPAPERAESVDRDHGSGDEQQAIRRLQRPRRAAGNLGEAGGEPPQRRPAQRQFGRQRCRARDPAQGARRQERGADHDGGAEHRIVGHRQPAVQRMPAEEQGGAGGKLHQQAGALGDRPARAHPVPDHGGAFGGPEGGSHLGVEGERHRDGCKEGGDPEMGDGDDRRAAAGAAHDQPPQQEVPERAGQRAPRQAVGGVADELRLQEAARERRAEKQHAVLPPGAAGRAEDDGGDRHRRVGGEEENDEGLRHQVVRRMVVGDRPGHADRKREHEAGDIEDTPCPEPVDAQDEHVEQCEIEEERQRRRRLSAGEHRREEGAGKTERRQRRAVLARGKGDAADAERGEGGEREPLADHRVAGKHEIADEVEQREAAALQRQPEDAVAGKARPRHAKGDQSDAGDRRGDQAHRYRQQPMIDRQAQTRGDAEEEEDDADLGERVGFPKPLEPARNCQPVAGDPERGLDIRSHRVGMDGGRIAFGPWRRRGGTGGRPARFEQGIEIDPAPLGFTSRRRADGGGARRNG